MSLSSSPSQETPTTDGRAVIAGIDYTARATYHRRISTRGGPSWTCSREMSLRDAILLAVKKFRVGDEPAVTCAGLGLFGIDAILAVRERPDFPEPDIPESKPAATLSDTVIHLDVQRRRRDRQASRSRGTPAATKTGS